MSSKSVKIDMYDTSANLGVKLGLPSNIYVNLVHIDGMLAKLNMAKNLWLSQKETSLGASAISNIPFMASFKS